MAGKGCPFSSAVLHFKRVRISSVNVHSTSGSGSPSPFKPSIIRMKRERFPLNIASFSLKMSYRATFRYGIFDLFKVKFAFGIK